MCHFSAMFTKSIGDQPSDFELALWLCTVGVTDGDQACFAVLV